MDGVKEQLIGDITNLFIKSNPGSDFQQVKNQLYMIFKDYNIGATETAVAVRDENKNQWLLNRFIIAKTVKGCSERTIKQYKQEIGRALLEIDKNADDITADDIRLYLAVKERKQGWTKTSCDNMLRYLRTFFAYLATEELIPKNPTVKIDTIKSPRKAKKAFTEMETELLRGACRNTKESAIVELLFSTGCRVSELVGIKIEEIDSDQVLIHGKGNKDRMAYLNAKAQLALKNYLKERKDENPYLFPKIMNGKEAAQIGKMNLLREGAYKYPTLIVDGHMDKSSVEQFVRSLAKRCGVAGAHPHRFRRTCATFALRHGMPIEQVSKMLGHEQLDTTKIYLDQDEQLLKEAHKRFVI